MDSSIQNSKKEELKQIIIGQGLKWGEGLDKNGKILAWMFDLRQILLTPKGMELSSELAYQRLKKVECDAVGGPMYAAIPLSVGIIQESLKKGVEKKGFVIRKQANTYGMKKVIEGPVHSGDSVIIVDDVVNTGESIEDSIKKVQKIGCKVVAVFSLVNFKNRLRFGKIPLISIYNLQDFNLRAKSDISIDSTNFERIDAKKMNLRKEFQGKKVEHQESYEGGHIFCSVDSLYRVEGDKVIWSVKFQGAISTPFTVCEKEVVITTSPGMRLSHVNKVDIHSGSLIHQKLIRDNITAQTCSGNGTYLGTKSGNVLFYDFSNDAVNLLHRGSQEIYYLLHSEDSLFFFCKDNSIASLNSGSILWERKLGRMSKKPIEFSEYLVLECNGYLFCIKKSNGVIQWHTPLVQKLKDYLLVDNQVYVGCESGYVQAFSFDNGKLLHTCKVSNSDVSQLQEKDGGIIVETEDGYSYKI